MATAVHGKVKAGTVELDEPLDVPDGTDVVVLVASSEAPAGQLTGEEYRSLPFFGMCKDEMNRRDGVEVINEERAKWQARPFRPG